MRLLYKILLAGAFACASVAQAQNKVGNGGKVVVCQDQVRLLDFYEEKVDPETDGDAKSTAAKAYVALAKAAPRLASVYQKRLDSITDEIEFKKDVVLTDSADSKHLFEPKQESCQVAQVALRRSQVLPGEKRFLFRQDLWDKMSASQQAGLLSHEILYEHLAKLGEVDSVKVRKLNRYLFAGAYERKDFWRFVRDLEIPIYP